MIVATFGKRSVEAFWQSSIKICLLPMLTTSLMFTFSESICPNVMLVIPEGLPFGLSAMHVFIFNLLSQIVSVNYTKLPSRFHFLLIHYLRIINTIQERVY